ncbi:LysM peptidoglycan-binding domain-containing protein [Pseudoprevotella muciniphila]|uniref:LysM peptidoglycan-binding domain-containing protein n=2 Tax=Pseudoprevotella muciniphila TaxID=2133944 RepID=A0A5P8E557_9BACT|nr:LysM peptidoglycan-binding domain-containing protein [Pseudoprevotella muciniphila]
MVFPIVFLNFANGKVKGNIMKNVRTLLGSCLVILFLAVGIVPVLAQSGVIQYRVQEHETLYGISRQHGTTIEKIISVNPGLQPENLKAGQTIKIPTEARNSTQVAKEGGQHEVMEGETIWGISHKYGLTISELISANPEMNNSDYVLRAGSTLNIPSRNKSSARPSASSKPEQKAVASSQGKSKEIKIAIVMPMSGDKPEVGRCAEFYRGLLMAAETMKQRGKTITIYPYEESSDGDVLSILGQIEKNGVDIIYGPLYPSHFATMGVFTNRTGIKAIVPFSSKVESVNSCRNMYIVNTPAKVQNTNACTLFKKHFPGSHVVFLRTSQTQDDFVAAMKSNLRQDQYSELPMGFSNNDILSIASGKRELVLIPTDKSEGTLKETLTRLERLRSEMPKIKTVLFGYPEWEKFQETYVHRLCAADAYVFASFYYNPYDASTTSKMEAYKKRYGAPMLNFYPRYGLLGYDVGLQTMSNYFNYGKSFTTQVSSEAYLQSLLKFQSANKDGGYVNGNVWFMHFRTDNTIERISSR